MLIANGALIVGAVGADVIIGDEAIVGAGALVTARTKIAPNTLAMGVPAKPAREVDDRLRMAHQGPQQVYLRSKDTYRGPTFRPVE